MDRSLTILRKIPHLSLFYSRCSQKSPIFAETQVFLYVYIQMNACRSCFRALLVFSFVFIHWIVCASSCSFALLLSCSRGVSMCVHIDNCMSLLLFCSLAYINNDDCMSRLLFCSFTFVPFCCLAYIDTSNCMSRLLFCSFAFVLSCCLAL